MKVKFEVVLEIDVDGTSVPDVDNLIDMLNDRENTAMVLWNDYYDMEVTWSSDYKYQLLSEKSGEPYDPKAKTKKS